MPIDMSATAHPMLTIGDVMIDFVRLSTSPGYTVGAVLDIKFRQNLDTVTLSINSAVTQTC